MSSDFGYGFCLIKNGKSIIKIFVLFGNIKIMNYIREKNNSYEKENYHIYIFDIVKYYLIVRRSQFLQVTELESRMNF